MTVKEYLNKIEKKLDESLGGEMKEFIPRILKKLEPLSLSKFIKEGDPVLDLIEFRKIFDDTLSQGLTERLNEQGTLSVIDGVFQIIILEDMEFRMCLN